MAAELGEGAQSKLVSDLVTLIDWATVQLDHLNQYSAAEMARLVRDAHLRLNAALVLGGHQGVALPEEWAFLLALNACGMASPEKRPFLGEAFRRLMEGTVEDVHAFIEGTEPHKTRLIDIADAVLCLRGAPPSSGRLKHVPSSAHVEVFPGRTYRVLCVDDDAVSILSTLLAFAGWPGIELQAYHQRVPKKDDWEVACAWAVQDIRQSAPHIILMDAGLQVITGEGLMRRLLGQPDFSAIFIANTGGGPEGLYDLGALTNCSKGSNSRGLIQAIRLLNQK